MFAVHPCQRSIRLRAPSGCVRQSQTHGSRRRPVIRARDGRDEYSEEREQSSASADTNTDTAHKPSLGPEFATADAYRNLLNQLVS